MDKKGTDIEVWCSLNHPPSKRFNFSYSVKIKASDLCRIIYDLWAFVNYPTHTHSNQVSFPGISSIYWIKANPITVQINFPTLVNRFTQSAKSLSNILSLTSFRNLISTTRFGTSSFVVALSTCNHLATLYTLLLHQSLFSIHLKKMMMIKSFNSQFHANCLVSRNLQSNNVRNDDSIIIIIIIVSGNNTYNGGMQRVPQSLSITLRRWFNEVYPNYLSTLLYNKSRDQLPRTDLPIKLRIHKSCCRRRCLTRVRGLC